MCIYIILIRRSRRLPGNRLQEHAPPPTPPSSDDGHTSRDLRAYGRQPRACTVPCRMRKDCYQAKRAPAACGAVRWFALRNLEDVLTLGS